jgi:hypothetical protein
VNIYKLIHRDPGANSVMPYAPYGYIGTQPVWFVHHHDEVSGPGRTENPRYTGGFHVGDGSRWYVYVRPLANAFIGMSRCHTGGVPWDPNICHNNINWAPESLTVNGVAYLRFWADYVDYNTEIYLHYRIPPGCYFDSSGTVNLNAGSSISYTATGFDPNNDLSTTGSGLQVYTSSLSNPNSWSFVGQGNPTYSGSFTCLATNIGSHYIICNGRDTPGLACSGNPWCPWEPNDPPTTMSTCTGWVDCDASGRDWLLVNCSSSPLATLTPTSGTIPTITVTPTSVLPPTITPTVTLTPTIAPTPTPTPITVSGRIYEIIDPTLTCSSTWRTSVPGSGVTLMSAVSGPLVSTSINSNPYQANVALGNYSFLIPYSFPTDDRLGPSGGGNAALQISSLVGYEMACPPSSAWSIDPNGVSVTAHYYYTAWRGAWWQTDSVMIGLKMM